MFLWDGQFIKYVVHCLGVEGSRCLRLSSDPTTTQCICRGGGGGVERSAMDGSRRIGRIGEGGVGLAEIGCEDGDLCTFFFLPRVQFRFLVLLCVLPKRGFVC